MKHDFKSTLFRNFRFPRETAEDFYLLGRLSARTLLMKE